MAKNHESGNIITNVGEKDFTLERVFDAPRDLVFKAFTDPEHVSQWWAPAGFTMPVCTIDLQPGGIWHYCFESPEGERHWSRSVYKEIIEPEKIVYTSTLSDEKANPVESPLPEHLATVTFVENNGKTKLTVNIQLPSVLDLKATMDMGMMEGLKQTINNLEEHLKVVR
ncbi:SRPBCC domain-containing protein [Halobacillus salinarum]|uniref:SRPBCC domain-containing protein n=1 Tax=Halobacillus salinarum TaxID=2932257 RepID=A0ABY4EI64_9BACI|nr:SRPBCC domain-containing protein [Halobacillus salinarum]UOQ43752.1 SRPBCC domain-containing protein [Halobacillus salinarum]